MKTIKAELSVIIIGAILCFLLSGCKQQKHFDSYSFVKVEKKEQVHLTENTSSPSCNIHITYTYIAPQDKEDSVYIKINESARRMLLGAGYADLSDEAAVDSFYADYIRNYKNDVLDLYTEDLKAGTLKDDIPSWFYYEFELNNQWEEGKEGILNNTAFYTEYQGGAHPNSWEMWLNYDKKTARYLKKTDVFMEAASESIIALIQEELIRIKAEEHKDIKITSIDDLIENGIIIGDIEPYIPDNFLMQEENVLFLYNPYEISPYSEGSTVIKIPYTQIKKYMLY